MVQLADEREIHRATNLLSGVTRIEVQAAQGSERLVFAPTFQSIACTNPISFKITDGTTAFTLPLPSATTLVPGGFNPSSADSGPLDIAFAAGAKLVLTVVQGDPSDATTGATECLANNTNIRVQYRTATQEIYAPHAELTRAEMRGSKLWLPLGVLLFLAWAISYFVLHVAGVLIHLLLIFALISFMIYVFGGKRGVE